MEGVSFAEKGRVLTLNIQTEEVPELVSDPQKPVTGFTQGYGDVNMVINNSGHSILPALKSHDFDDNIKNMAEVVYHKMRYQMHRKTVWNQLLYYCTYCAYLELGETPDPFALGTKFGLNKSQVQECDSKFSFLQTGYKPPVVYTTAVNYLINYGRTLSFSVEAINDITTFAVRILEKKRALLEKNPQTVALAILRYYFEINGISLKLADSITNRPTATIEAMYREIAAIDNS